MGCPTVKQAFEDALSKSTLNTADELLIYDNGTIYTVTYGTFVTELGATGSLSPDSDSGSVDILTGTAPNYVLRGLRGGNGVGVQANIFGSITINANLNNKGGAADGERVLDNTTGTTLNFKRILAGNGIGVSSTANSITITNELVGATGDIVTVSELADLPSAVAGVITLADNTVYEFISDVSTSSRFVLGSNTVLRSADPYANTLTYTGTGTMFTTNNGNQSLHEMSFDCPNGQFIDTTGNTSGSLLIRWIRIIELKDFGVMEKPILGVYDVLIALWTGSVGLNFGTQTNARSIIDRITVLSATNAALTAIDLNGATFDAFSIDGFQVLASVSGQTFLTGAASGGNITGQNIGFVSGVVIEGDMVGLDTISVDDAGWDFTDNNVIENTDPHAVLSLDSPTATTISVAGTPVQVNGTFTTQNSQVMSVSAGGVVTYNGRRNKFARVDVTMSLEPVSGTNKVLFLQIAKNGTVVAVTKVTRTSSSGTAAVVSLDWALDLATGDTVSVFVGNDTDTVDVQVNQMLLRVA